MEYTYDWFKSQFTAADLKGKTVEFRLPDDNEGIAAGIGTFDAAQDARGYIRVAIVATRMAPGGGIEAKKFFIPVEEGSKIARNPAGSKSEFSFNAV